MNRPALIPSAANAEAAWDRYTALAIAWAENDRVRTDLEANKSLARAWEEWRDVFLALDKRC